MSNRGDLMYKEEIVIIIIAILCVIVVFRVATCAEMSPGMSGPACCHERR